MKYLLCFGLLFAFAVNVVAAVGVPKPRVTPTVCTDASTKPCCEKAGGNWSASGTAAKCCKHIEFSPSAGYWMSLFPLPATTSAGASCCKDVGGGTQYTVENPAGGSGAVCCSSNIQNPICCDKMDDGTLIILGGKKECCKDKDQSEFCCTNMNGGGKWNGQDCIPLS
jgi:hypothetical protein